MASLNHKCMSEDPADKYNYAWCAVFFIVLASACWIAPLALSKKPSSDKSLRNASMSVSERITVHSECWGSQGLTEAQMKYTNQICKYAMEAILNKESNDTSSMLASIYKEIPNPGDNRKQLSFPDFLVKREKTVEMKKGKKESLHHIVTETVPVFLFLIGVAFVIPKVIWSFIHSCGSLNIDKTLSAIANRRENSGSFVRETGVIVNRSLKTSRLAWGYLGIKLLYVLVCVVGVFYLSLNVRPELDKSVDTDTDYTISVSISEHTPYHDVLFCEFPIMRMSNVEHYLIQCDFVEEKRPQDVDVNGVTFQVYLDSLDNWSSSYVAVISVSREVMILMAIINIFQFVTWFARLVFRRHSSSLDQRLFSHLAYAHVDGMALAYLLEASGQHSRQDQGDGGTTKEEFQPL